MPKLRVLCLHGYNNNSRIMEFQMKNFISTFGAFIKFEFLEGPLDVKDSEPIEYFVQRGVKPPFRHWLRTDYDSHRDVPDGRIQILINKTNPNTGNGAEAVYYLL